MRLLVNGVLVNGVLVNGVLVNGVLVNGVLVLAVAVFSGAASVPDSMLEKVQGGNLQPDCEVQGFWETGCRIGNLPCEGKYKFGYQTYGELNTLQRMASGMNCPRRCDPVTGEKERPSINGCRPITAAPSF